MELGQLKKIFLSYSTQSLSFHWNRPRTLKQFWTIAQIIIHNSHEIPLLNFSILWLFQCLASTDNRRPVLLSITLVKWRKLNVSWTSSECLLYRSSQRRCSVRKGALSYFAKFTGKHLCQSLFLKKRLWRSCFPVNFTKFLRTTFLQNTSSVCTFDLHPLSRGMSD